MPCRAASVASTATAARAGDGMTADELTAAARLWQGGTSVKDISRALGYSVSYIQHTACRNRSLFPVRKHAGGKNRKREVWLARLQAGRATKRQVAEACNVSLQTVRRWLREAMQGGDA